MTDRGVPGVEDVAGLAAWLQDKGLSGGVPGVTLIAGGRSNLTYRLDFPAAGARRGSRGDRLVLRRPPLGHVLPTAHDMAREYRVITALRGSRVPVPRPVAFCGDVSVVGAPFYLMEWVDGVVLRNRDDLRGVTAAEAGELSRRFVEMLAAIHSIDVEQAGLAGFGKPVGYLSRQLARWQRQWELSATRLAPGYEELLVRLADGLPAGDEGGSLVHGDFRLDNMLIALDAQPRIAAVVDWEMSTLGDPLADLGLALVYWADPGEEDLLEFSRRGALTASPGFLTRAELADRYADITGRDLSRLGYYMAFGCFKLAVVLEGIHARFLQRKTVGEGFDRQGEVVPVLIERAHKLLDADI